MADNIGLQQPPRKSSNEILSELFGAFNAEPPPIITTGDLGTVDNSIGLSVEDKTEKLPKKRKKHHKKMKKRKKAGLESDNIEKNNDHKKHRHKKKHKKHKDKNEILSEPNKDNVSLEANREKDKKKKYKKTKKLTDKKTGSSSDESSAVQTGIKSKIDVNVDKIVNDEKNCRKISVDLDFSKNVDKSSIEKKLSSKSKRKVSSEHSTISSVLESKIAVQLKTVDEIDLTTDDPFELSNIKVPASIAKEEKKDVVADKISVDKIKVAVDDNIADNKNDSNNAIKGVANAFVEDCLESGVKPEKTVAALPEKRKFNMGNKIMIKNLKNSTVFEETVRQVEEQARLKAERYEEGEISDESTNNDSKTSSTSASPVVLSPSLLTLPKITVENILKSPCRRKSSENGHSSGNRGHGHKHHKSSTAGSSSSSRKRSKSKEKHKSSKRKSRSKSPPKQASSHINKKSRSKSKSKERDKSSSNRRKKHRSSDRKHRHRHHRSTRRRSSASPNDRDYYRSGRSYRSKRYSKSKSKSRSRSRSRSRGRSRSPYSKERRQDGQEKIDKQRLLEIARKNALNMLKQSNSAGAGSGNASGACVEQTKATIAAGGKTVDELTDFCKLLSKKDAEGHESISSNTSNNSSDSESEKPFHHPFQIKDRPQSIVLNIRNSVAVPVKTLQEKTAEQSKALRMQFPVSSGQLHRKKESDWVPVSPKSEQQNNHFGFGHQSNGGGGGGGGNVTTAVVPPMSVQVTYPGQSAMVQPSLGSPSLPPPLLPPPLPPLLPVQPISYPAPLLPDQMYGSNSVQLGACGPQGFEDQQLSGGGSNVDITSAVVHRLSAMKRLQQNPNDVEAMIEMKKAQQEAQAWVQSKYEPGQFTGTTGARVLSQAELASGTQAWARKDQLNAAAPVQSGMGMAMLQKMGWRPGEGLGKNKEGTLEPLKLQVKMDKKGLVASDEVGYNPSQSKSVPKNFYEGKHPVSLLNELCSRKRYGPPVFDCCFETGPDHKKNFIFKVTVNGIEYKPSIASQNKKQAKVEAASLCLRALGLIH